MALTEEQNQARERDRAKAKAIAEAKSRAATAPTGSGGARPRATRRTIAERTQGMVDSAGNLANYSNRGAANMFGFLVGAGPEAMGGILRAVGFPEDIPVNIAGYEVNLGARGGQIEAAQDATRTAVNAAYAGIDSIIPTKEETRLPTGEPTTLAENVAQFVGEGIVSVGGVQKGAQKLAQLGNPLVRRIGQSLTSGFQTRPGREMTLEMLGEAGAGVGATVAPGGPIGQAAGALVGGVGGTAGASLAAQRGKATMMLPYEYVRNVRRGDGIFGSFADTPPGRAVGRLNGRSNLMARQKVGEVLYRYLGPDAVEAMQRAVTDNVPIYSVGDRDLNILSRFAENLGNPNSNDYSNFVTEDFQNRIAALRDSLYQAENVDDLTTLADLIIKQNREAVNVVLANAEKQAFELVEGMRAGAIEPSELAETLVQRIDEADTLARAQEAAYWNRVPDNVNVNVEASLKAYDEILRRDDLSKKMLQQNEEINTILGPVLRRRQQDNKIMRLRKKGMSHAAIAEEMGLAKSTIQSRINNINNPNRYAISYSNLKALRSSLADVAAKARSGQDPNRNLANIAETMRGSLLDSIDNTVSNASLRRGMSEEDVQAIRIATAFSREYNTKFGQGFVGRILQKKPSGERSVNPKEALSTTFGSTPSKRLASVENMDNAMNVEAIKESLDSDHFMEIRNFLRGEFIRTTVPDFRTGKINANAARRYEERYRTLLDLFPDVKADIKNANDAFDVVDSAAGGVKSFEDLMSSRHSPQGFAVLSELTGGKSGQEIARTLFSSTGRRNPVDAVRQLVTQINKHGNPDEARNALDAAKYSVQEFIGTLSGVPTRYAQEAGEATKLSASRGMDFINKRANREAMELLFDPEEIRNIEKSLERLRDLEVYQNTPKTAGENIPELIKIRENRLFTIIGQVAGARGATAGSNFLNRTLQSLGLPTPSNAGTDIQTANIGSQEGRRLFENMTAGKAQRLLIDALRDPKLMEALILDRRRATDAQIRRSNRAIRAYAVSAGKDLMEPVGEEPESESRIREAGERQAERLAQ